VIGDFALNDSFARWLRRYLLPVPARSTCMGSTASYEFVLPMSI